MKFCASYQVQCLLTVLYPETRRNAKPENVRRNSKTNYGHNRNSIRLLY